MDANNYTNDFYKRASRLIVNKKLKKLVKHIDATAESTIESSGFEISPAMWSKEINHAAKVKVNLKRIPLILLGTLLLALLVVFAIWFINKKIEIQATEPPLINSEVAEVVIVTAAPTLTPSPTFTATSFPVSSFLVSDPISISPATPMTSEELFLIPWSSAIAVPSIEDRGIWINDGDAYYTQNNDVSVRWSMDQPLNNGGLFAVYFADRKYSIGKYQFIFSSKDVLIEPFRGSGIVDLKSSTEHPNDTWQLVGFYQFFPGQLIDVNLTTNISTPNDIFRLDDVLFVRLDDSQSKMINQLPVGRKMTIFLDDLLAKRYELNLDTNTYNEVIEGWLFESREDAYRGEISAHTPGWNSGIRIVYPTFEIQAEGKYELIAWIPSGATAETSYGIWYGEEQLVPDTPRRINQSNYSSEWASLGIWELSKPGKYSVKVDVVPDPTGQVRFVIDAIALLFAD